MEAPPGARDARLDGVSHQLVTHEAGNTSIGAGRRGWSITIDGSDLIDLPSADVADVTKPDNQS